MNLFEKQANIPLATRLRPQLLSEIVGQQHLLGKNKILSKLIESDTIPSMILWGPPGTGKTTIANIIAKYTKSEFIELSAITSGIKDIKDIMNTAESNRQVGKKTLLFIDEIHRFNKSQQDAFLPFIEKGSIILIGATTENPSFEINNALLSRCKVFVLNSLDIDDIIKLLQRALSSPLGFGASNIEISNTILKLIAQSANGDARNALSLLEIIITNSEYSNKDKIIVKEDLVKQCISNKTLLYDRNGEEHYNLISALHKSMRNSDPDAAIYWLARMLESGEDPLYIARRIVRFASEDVGLADPKALELAVSAYHACHFIGMPECSVNLSQIVIYLSLSPKSNSVYVAYNKARAEVLKNINEPVPIAIRNAPNKMMKNLGYGKEYQNPHDMSDKLSIINCLPDRLAQAEFYTPGTQGMEEKYKIRIEQIKKWKREHRSQNPHTAKGGEV